MDALFVVKLPFFFLPCLLIKTRQCKAYFLSPFPFHPDSFPFFLPICSVIFFLLLHIYIKFNYALWRLVFNLLDFDESILLLSITYVTLSMFVCSSVTYAMFLIVFPLLHVVPASCFSSFLLQLVTFHGHDSKLAYIFCV